MTLTKGLSLAAALKTCYGHINNLNCGVSISSGVCSISYHNQVAASVGVVAGSVQNLVQPAVQPGINATKLSRNSALLRAAVMA